MVARAQPVGNALEAPLREERALAAALLLRDFQHAVDAYPTLPAGFVPFAGADVEPFLFIRMLRVGRNQQAQNCRAGAGDNKHSAFARRGLFAFGRRPDPHHFTRVSLAIHVGREEDAAGMGGGSLDADVGGFARFRDDIGLVHSEAFGDALEAVIDRLGASEA